MPIPPVTPAPQKVPDITQQDFANRLLKPTGDGNRKLGLGNLVSNRPEQRDLTNDGVAEWIYSFSSGQKLIVVSNMNAWGVTGTRQEQIMKQELVGYEDDRTETYEVSPATTKQVTHTDCSERDAAQKALDNYEHFTGKPEYVDGRLVPTLDKEKQAELEAKVAAGCKTWTETVDVPAKYDTYEVDGEPIYKEVPTGRTRTVDVYGYMADFGNLDGDPKTPETWIANIVWGDDPDTRNIENEVRRAVVVVGNPPPPPPKRIDQNPAPIILDDKN